MKQKTLIIAFLFFNFYSFSQQEKIDSLKNELEKTTNENERTNILSDLCSNFAENHIFKDTKIYIQEFINLSKKQNNDTNFINANLSLSTFYIMKNDLDSALDFALIAKTISEETKNINKTIISLTQIYTIYGKMGKYNNEDSIFNIGMNIIKNEYQSEAFCSFYSNYALSLFNRGNEEDAIIYYLKAMDCSEKNENYMIQADCYYGLSWIYFDRKQYKKSENYALEGIKIINDRSDYHKSVLYTILGMIYYRYNEINRAIYYQKKSLECFETISDYIAVQDVSNKISELYLKKKDYKNSLIYVKKSLKISKRQKNGLLINSAKSLKAMALLGLGNNYQAIQIMNSIEKDTVNKENWPDYIQKDFFISMIKFQKKIGNYKKALKYSIKLLKLKDSLSTARYTNQVVSLETKYQTEKKEKENLQLKKEKAEQTLILQKEKQKKIYFATALIVSVLFILIFSYYFRRNKKQKQLIENLQKELHHRIKNNLSVIDTFIEVAKEEFDAPAFNNKLTELQNRIAGINEVHKQLYVSKDITNLNLKNYIDKLAKNVASSFNNKNVELIQYIEDDIKLYADKLFPVGLIINEFITNSFKYAFGENIKGKIKIKVEETKNAFSLMLSDNGKGLPENFDIEQTQTFGMRIMKLLTKQLKGTFKLENKNGLKINIQFPK